MDEDIVEKAEIYAARRAAEPFALKSLAAFVLDFAGAYLDFAPEFSDEIWEEWERKNQEQFGSDWPMAQIILGELRDLGRARCSLLTDCCG